MKCVVSAEEMKWCDESTIKTYGIPGLLLMENAGKAVVDIIKKEFGSLGSTCVLIVCGKGNNGGDGFVVARLLLNTGARIHVIMMAEPSELKGDAKKNFLTLTKLAKKSPEILSIYKYSKKVTAKIPKPDIIVDAIFGTGFSGTVRRPITEMIEWMNHQQSKIFSVDIPSGVSGTTGVVENCAVQANATITFGFLKSGLLCNQGREHAGSLYVADIGIPKCVKKDKRLQTSLVDRTDVQRVLPKRSVHAHKYSVGKVLVLAGSNGLTGAAAMCCNSAMRSGAGAVVLGTPESVYPILAKKLTEVMVSPLPATSEGTLSLSAFDTISERIEWADVLVIGPGLSQNRETQKLIMRILVSFRKKTLIDADGLNAIAENGVNKLRSMRAPFILTPHVGEFTRMTKLSSADVERCRIDVARDLAKRINSTIVLKGVPTVTASKDGSVVLNSNGNPGMATAGAGDVLSGIIAGLWAQGMRDAEAAWAGVFLHGLSGDIVAHRIGQRSLMANDLIEQLPEAFRIVETGSNK
jgi:hydroxyethylthiazole kinase-like uncharacterized protein yjeF